MTTHASGSASQVTVPTASVPGCGVASAATAALRTTLAQLVAQRKTPGAQYAFVDEQGILVSAVSGQADLQRSIPVREQTLFHGYSVTKTFTAAALVLLALQKRLDLDAPIVRYLPELADARSPSLRQVLCHTAGYANPIPIGWVHRAAEHDAFDAAAFFAQVADKHGRVLRPPGETFAYSNVGYLFLGEVVQRVSGLPFAAFVEQQIIAPLRLPEGAVLRFSMGDPAAHARGYVARWSVLNALLGLFISRRRVLAGTHSGWTQFHDMQVHGAAYGGILGNAAGFARYLQALLRKDPPFSAEVCECLFAPQKTHAGADIPMALSWFRGACRGEPYFDHAGGGGGYYCELRLYPQRRCASVLLLNRTGVKNDHLLDGIDAPLLDSARASRLGDVG